MAGRNWTPEMEAWLAEAYPTEHEGWIVAELKRHFGREVSVPALRTKAWRMGLAKVPRTVPEHATRRVRWSVEPEMDAWMRGHDTGQSPSLLSRRLVRTCPECLAAGRKAPASAHGAVAVRTCAVCGREFGATRANQRRCPECIARHPKWSAELQAHLERRR